MPLRLNQMKDKIYSMKDGDFINELIKSEERFFNRLQELTEGTIEYRMTGDYFIAAKKQIWKAKTCMKAVVLVRPEEWRENGTLELYLDEQIKAIKERKIKVTRIFLLDKNQINNKNNINIMQKHFNGGIDVYYAEKENISEKIPDILTEAFVIYDDEVLFVGAVSPASNKITKGIKTINNNKIFRKKEVFNELLLNYSKKFINGSNSL